jgi:glycosyltransferase involved in cell wall biosynthesis
LTELKISIITVCYNSSKTIEDTIKSVLSQSFFENIQYIIIDGGSTDTTLEIISKYSDKIDVFVTEKDKGLYDAMNKGVKIASGDVIGFINSDDIFCDNQALEKVMKIFCDNSSLDSVYADLYYVSQYNQNVIIRKWISGEQKSFSVGWHPAHPTLYIKKNIYEKYGLFNLEFKLASDFELMLRFFDRYKISSYYIPEVFVKMRLGGETNKNLINIFKQNFECIRAFHLNGLKINFILYLVRRLLSKIFQFSCL